MKVLSGISVLALLIAGAATPSFATSLAPGGTVAPTVVTGNFFSTFTVLGDTGTVAYTQGDDSGTIREWVGTWSGNPVSGDDMVFVYQVTLNGGDAERVTGGSYAGFTTDVFTNVDGSGNYGPVRFHAHERLRSCGWFRLQPESGASLHDLPIDRRHKCQRLYNRADVGD